LASHIVEGDLAYEIDGRELPPDCPTGIVPFDRADVPRSHTITVPAP
jgi:purine nucleoside permease